MQIQLLDCTLRDGAHVNGGDFGEFRIKNIMSGLARSCVDIIELGFVTNNYSSEQSTTLFGDTAAVDKLIDDTGRFGAEFSVMVRPDQCDTGRLKTKKNIDWVRVAFYEEDLGLACRTIKHCVELGYKVGANPVAVSHISVENLKAIAGAVSEAGADAFSIVDTFGALSQSKVVELLPAVKENSPKSVILGVHLHENLASSQSIMASVLSNCGGSRRLVIDASLWGMGRIPGNMQTELAAAILNDRCNGKYELKGLVKLLQDEIRVELEKNKWGYHPVFALTGIFNIHRSYGEQVLTQEVCLKEAYSFFETISWDRDKARRFDAKLLGEFYAR